MAWPNQKDNGNDYPPRNIPQYRNNNRTGYWFEDNVFAIMSGYVEHISKNPFRKSVFEKVEKSTMRQDTRQGTDMILTAISPFGEKVRICIDPTAHISGKDHMPFKFDTKIAVGGHSVDTYTVGIRIGNDHRTFKEPVVVFGGTIDHYAGYNNYNKDKDLTEKIHKDLSNNMSHVLQAIYDAYFDYMTIDENERAQLERTPLNKTQRIYGEPPAESEYRRNYDQQIQLIQGNEKQEYDYNNIG